jgi:hypothetical protein
LQKLDYFSVFQATVRAQLTTTAPIVNPMQLAASSTIRKKQEGIIAAKTLTIATTAVTE